MFKRIIFPILISIMLAGCGASTATQPTLSSSKDIMVFSIDGDTAVISESDNTIALSLANGVNRESLIATFTTDGDYVTVNGVVQTSGVTANDFTQPVTYTVHAADSSTHEYTVYIRPHSAYVLSRVGSPENVLFKCAVDESGSFTNCANTGSFAVPVYMFMSNDQNWLYVSSDQEHNIVKCVIESNGSVGECSNPMTGLAIHAIYSASFNASGNIVYLLDVIDGSNMTIYKCNVTQNGDFESCVDTNSTVFSPLSLVIDRSGSFAYVADGAFAEVNMCAIDENGLFTNCIDTGTRGQLGLTIDYVHGNLYSSLPSSSAITVARMAESGTLSNYTETSLSEVYGLALNSDSTQLYLANRVLNSVTKCALDESGVISNTCSDSGAGNIFTETYGVIITK